MKTLNASAVALAAGLAMAQGAARGATTGSRARSVCTSGPVSFRRASWISKRTGLDPARSVGDSYMVYGNPFGTTMIRPDLGRVTPRGARQVSPARTTTYTLTVADLIISC